MLAWYWDLVWRILGIVRTYAKSPDAFVIPVAIVQLALATTANAVTAIPVITAAILAAGVQADAAHPKSKLKNPANWLGFFLDVAFPFLLILPCRLNNKLIPGLLFLWFDG